MENNLINGLRTADNLTENGMVTNSSSLNSCVDLFFTIGAMRGQDKERLIANFSKAFAENPLTALKIMFWVRDVRGGAGERQIFRDILVYLAENHSKILSNNIVHIPEYGRWDDLLVLFNTKLDKQAKDLIVNALKAKDNLLAKWLPRKGKNAIALERYMKLKPKEYRKLLVENTNVVETLMCKKTFDIIKYEHVPSLAMARYSKAFGKHDADRFEIYKTSDETKINTAALYPYDVIKTLKSGDKDIAIKQWNALPDFMVDNKERVLPMCDVSGSMETSVGKNANLTCMDICISLGLYISERNVGIFKDAFLTFSKSPNLQYLKGSLSDRLRQLEHADWGMDTNIESAFNLILNCAIKNNLPESEMPTMILIMSDMEFNQCTNINESAIDMIRRKYITNGYIIPKIVFWNIQARHSGNSPVQINDTNTALISGFSPAILKSLLSGEDTSPINVMNNTLNVARYERITI